MYIRPRISELLLELVLKLVLGAREHLNPRYLFGDLNYEYYLKCT